MQRWMMESKNRIEAAGINVLDIIEVPGKEPIFVTDTTGIDMLIELYDRDEYQGLGYDYIAPLRNGGFVDATSSECFVQQSDTYIGILHDVWCSDVDWWDGENSIREVDEFVKNHGIPDDLEHYQMVMDCITSGTEPMQCGSKNIRSKGRSVKKRR